MVQDVRGEEIPEILREDMIGEESIFEGRVVHVKQRLIRQYDASLHLREVVQHNGGVGILAISPAQEIFMVRQFRTAANSALLEIPAGKLELDEDPLECAKRELEEECGIEAKSLHFLGQFFPTPGYCSEIIHLYWTDDYIQGAQHLDDGEELELYKVPLDTAIDMIQDGQILDGKTQVAILKYVNRLTRGKDE